MTLVIGRVTPHHVVLLSDTRQQDPRQTRGTPSVMTGTLKATFLGQSAAVAFTGNIDLAQRAIRSIGGRFVGFRATIEHFVKETRDNENEYLLAFAGPKRLFHIRAGSSQESKQAWIGDKDGFERFQEGPRPTNGSDFWQSTMCGPLEEDGERVHDLIARLRAVSEDPAVSSVGDFFTVAVGRDDKFTFKMVATAYFDAEGVIRAPNGSTILSSTGENRAYRFFKWVPEQDGIAAAAYVFPEVKQCYAFYARDGGFADQCIPISGFEGEGLRSELKRLVGISFGYLELRHVGDPSVR